MLEILKSITEKINNIKNNKLNNSNVSIYVFLLCLLPLVSIFIADEKLSALLFSILSFFMFAIIFYFSNVIEKTFNYFNKKEFFKLLNKEEKKILEKSKIDFSLFDIKETLFQIQKLCIDNVSSEKELKDILLFILNNKDNKDIDIHKKTFTIQIIDYIKKNKYCNETLINLIYEEENNFKTINYTIVDYSDNKNYNCKLFDLIYEKSSLSQIIKYNNYSEELSAIGIFKKILEKIEIKSLIKIIFEKDKRKLNNNELEILDFFNTLDLEKLVNIKKNILDKTLNLKDKNNIEFYETEFLELCKRLDVDKKLLYIMEESLVTKKEEKLSLKIINI